MSIPNSSHSLLFSKTCFLSTKLTNGPIAYKLWYSIRTDFPLSPGIFISFSQPMVQFAQWADETFSSRCNDSPEIFSAYSCDPSLKFAVGKTFKRLKMDIFAIVPIFLYFSVANPRLFLAISPLIFRIAFGSETSIVLRPIKEMALTLLDPITAPAPVRPAWRPPSLLMLANLTKFSPAGPIQAIL